MNTQKINRQDRRSHIPWIWLPQGDLPTVHSRYTHRSSALPGGPIGGLSSLSLTSKSSWIHLGGRVTKLLVSCLTPVPPNSLLCLTFHFVGFFLQGIYRCVILLHPCISWFASVMIINMAYFYDTNVEWLDVIRDQSIRFLNDLDPRSSQ